MSTANQGSAGKTPATARRDAAAGPGRDGAALNYLRYFWDGEYAITAGGDGSLTARACFGRNDVLKARTAQQLGTVMRDHYPGGPVFRCST
jgi:hypothetical protein